MMAAPVAIIIGAPISNRLLTLHGVLHLAGYDHESDNGQMARKEAALRRRFGLSAGLIERSRDPEDGRRMEFTSEYPADLAAALDVLRAES